MNADCSNSNGSFTCSCKSGYSGNGLVCEGLYTTLSMQIVHDDMEYSDCVLYCISTIFHCIRYQ